MSVNYPSNRSNNYDKTKNYREMIHLDGKPYTGNDANNLQSIITEKIFDLAESIHREGDLLEGGTPVLIQSTGELTISPGRIYIDKEIFEFNEVVFDGSTLPVLPDNEDTEIGVFLEQDIITHIEDPVGLVDPSTNQITSGQPTNQRLRKQIVWGWKNTDNSADSGNSTGTFYPVHRSINRVLLIQTEAPGLGAVQEAIAQYDRESTGGGMYLSNGLDVSYDSADGDDYLFAVESGLARVNGFPIRRATGEELVVTQDPDLSLVQNENKNQEVIGGEALIEPNNTPLNDVVSVVAYMRVTETITRGVVANTTDDPEEDGIDFIEQITQGGTTYTKGVDYQLTDGEIDWSLGGIEPSGGTTYDATYRFTKTIGIKAGSLTPTSFIIEDQEGGTKTLVDGSNALINYNYKLQRVDLLELQQDQTITRSKGVSRSVNPQAPQAKPGNLRLATVFFDWVNDPVVTMVAPQVISVGQLNTLQQQVTSTSLVLAEMAQSQQINLLDNAVKTGMFVDNFADESQRDLGISQSAKIAGSMLTMGMTVEDHYPSEGSNNNDNVNTLPFTLVSVVSQEKQTGQVQINPYIEAHVPPPKPVVITPKVDHNITQFTQPFISRGPVAPQAPIAPPDNSGGTDNTTAVNIPQPSLDIARGKKTTVTPPPSSWDQAYAAAQQYHQNNRTNPNRTSINKKQQNKINNLAASLLAGENVANIKIDGKRVTVNQS